MSNEPLNDLERIITRASDHRLQAPSPERTVGRRWWMYGRGLLVALATLGATAAVATAAVVTLNRSPSAPSAGPLPPARRDGPARSYAVLLAPDLHVGRTGWCSSLILKQHGRRGFAGGGSCGPAPTRSPYIAGGTSLEAGTGEIENAIVDQTIGGVRLPDGTVIVPRSDPRLPDGWGSIVLLPGGPKGLFASGATFLDARGQPISQSNLQHAVVAGRASRLVTGSGPPDAPCRLTGRSGVVVRQSRLLNNTPTGAPQSPGRPLLACAAATVSYASDRLTVTVLVDANDPGTRPARIPATTPTREDANTYVLPATIESRAGLARRSGNTWIVVQGATRPMQAETLDRTAASVR